MRRGELWSVAGGVDVSKPWPALILQDDLFVATVSVTVAPLTSTLIDAPPCYGCGSTLTMSLASNRRATS